jgi:hypothetical protein
MKTGKIKPVSTTVLQFPAGVEINVIEHEGIMYFPMANFASLFGESDTEHAALAPEPKTKKSAPAPEPEEKTANKSFTEDELTEMDVKELTKILKGIFGINPDDYDGKNTNKKLRLLILKAQADGGEEAVEEDEEDDENDKPAPKPKKSAKKPSDDEQDLEETVGDLLERFDEGDLKKKKAIDEIVALGDDLDSDVVADLLDEFSESEDSIEDWTDKIVDFIKTGKVAKKKPAAKGKKSKDEDLVAPEDLEVGDRVSVWWDNDEQDWFDGEVKSIKGKKIMIHYDDDTDEKLDPEVHTKIKRLDD